MTTLADEAQLEQAGHYGRVVVALLIEASSDVDRRGRLAAVNALAKKDGGNVIDAVTQQLWHCRPFLAGDTRRGRRASKPTGT
jgi:hypothetical protein